jgi:RNA polymerase sigma-70 factor (ECF subfamily)
MIILLLSIASEEQKIKFEQLYQLYKDLMMYISLKILKKKELAEEAVQESLIKILINIDDAGEIKCHETKSWIVVITKRTAFNKLKYEKRRDHENDNVLEYTNFSKISIEDIAIQEIAIERVKAGLENLDDKYSECIILRYYFGYSNSKLAKHFKGSAEVIRKRCERGRKKLIKKLAAIEGENNEKV